MKRLCGIILFCMLTTTLHAPQVLYVSEGNLFDGEFKSTVESLYVICFDAYFYTLSTHEENRINISAYYLKTFLEERGRTLKDVAIMMHNHFGMPMLSNPDRIFLLRLRNYGFCGSFGIYITSTGKIVYEKPWLKGIK